MNHLLPSSPNNPGTPTSKKRKASLSTSMILLLIFSNGVSFLGGAFYASNAVVSTSFQQQQLPNQDCPPPQQCRELPEADCPPPPQCPECQAAVATKEEGCPTCQECPTTELSSALLPGRQQQRRQQQDLITASGSSKLFPEITSQFAVGMAHTTQENFTNLFDLGVPIDTPAKEGDKGVLILYSSLSALPRKNGQLYSKTNALLSAQEATENCDYMNVVLTAHEGKRRRQCLAIVPQYESFHIQKWMRVPEKGPGDPGYPLRMVPRGYSMSGNAAFHPPHLEKHSKRAWDMLKKYLDSLEDVVKELTPIVKKIAIQNAIVVMVCNFGQSQLLLNFACAAKSKGLDVSNVLVFATDEETRELAESVGLTAYFDKRNFGSMPKNAAKTYGDGAFTTMMLSKVMCVHMASMVGVDFLFQDVDVLWYKNPVPYFQDKTSSIADFDAYFQDDGSRSLRFSPFCANSGFYFIRHNQRTQYFLTSFLMQSDLILRSFSHQSAMISILAEHSSLLGLRVKTLGHAEFPSGFIYHRKKGKGRWGNFFMELFEGKQDPYVVHMSWTENKENKILYYRQMDQWYLQDQCMDKKVSDISLAGAGFVDTCCSAEPLFSCHYRDKPSSRPCKDSPALDKDGQSFW